MKFTPDAFGEGRDRRMTIVEILTLMAFFVSLLTLIVTLVHVTFDITFRMLESRNKKDDKKKKCPPNVPQRTVIFSLTCQ